ncbi:MAG: Ig domain-containing protein, partial [bacterium]
MNFNRSLVAIVSIFALSLSASGCVFSPAQDEVGLKKMQMETQVSNIGSEEDAETDLDADLDAEELDAEISKEEEEEGSVFGRIPPMRIVGSIRPIDERENIPMSIGDISIMPYPDPVDATIAAGGDYWQQFTASAYGNPGMYFAWTVTGLPAGLTYSLNGSYSQNLVIYGAPTAAGSYPIFLRAAQYADSTNYEEHSYTLVVSGQGDDDDDDDDDEVDDGDPCSQPLEVKIKEIGELTICPEGYTGPDNCFDPATDALPSTLGKKFSIGLEVSGGKAPYVWKVDSRVKDSFHRYNAGEGEPGKFPRGITNYEYRYPDKPCLSPEEAAEIAASMSMGQFGSFWPDCSKSLLTQEEKRICALIGCSKDDWPSGPYGSPEHELALQCVSGFNCPSGPGGMFGLTEGQRKACEEYEAWVNKNKKTIELQ